MFLCKKYAPLGPNNASYILYIHTYIHTCNYSGTSTFYNESANPRRRALASYTHAIHVYACAVLLLVGWSINFYIQLVVAYQLAESQSLACYTTHAGVDTRPAWQLLMPPRYAELIEISQC